MPEPTPRRWMRQRDLARWLGISDRTVRRLVADQRIEVAARIGRIPLFDPDAVARRLMRDVTHQRSSKAMAG